MAGPRKKDAPVTCDECRDLLQEHVDAEVGPAERAALDAHLSGCAECARLYRQLAKFTTTLVKSVSSAKPAKDFASKVLRRYEESKSDLRKVPLEDVELPAAPAPVKTYPVWPFAAGIGVALLLGLLLLFGGRRSGEALGALERGVSSARILSYEDGSWRESAGRSAVHNGDRVEAVEPPGAVVEIDLAPKAPARLCLRAPGKVQLEREGSRLLVLPTFDNPGRLLLKTTGSAKAEVRSIRVVYGKASVEVPCGERCVVDIEPGAGMELSAAVRSGSAKVSNGGETQSVAEGFARTVPQNGPCGAATQAKPEAFSWADEQP